MSPRIALLAVVGLIGLAAALPVADAAGSPPVPQGFVGVNADGPLFYGAGTAADLSHQFAMMASGGVETVRVVFDWAHAQPYSGWSDVPASEAGQFTDVDGIPTRFGPLDQIVGLAAHYRIGLLPVIIDSPPWDAYAIPAGGAEANPRSVYWYGQFAKGLVQRYGPSGSFWRDHSPKQAIRNWQIWNEPDLKSYWLVQPFARSYVTMLAAARAAIKSVDPAARIVLAGLTNVSWRDLASVYKVKGARSLFDVVSVHPYTRKPQGVITILQDARRVMNAAGDRRKPLVADEVSWVSSVGKLRRTLPWATTEAQQARNVQEVMSLLAQNRARLRLGGFSYYNWSGRQAPKSSPWNFAGLFNETAHGLVAKPAWSAFKRTALELEHCRAKVVATACS